MIRPNTRLVLLFGLATALCADVALAIDPIGSGDPTLRVAYLIPSDRTPQPAAVGNLQEILIAMRAWYCEQMDRNGVGKLAPRYEFEADGITPVIYTVFVSETRDEIRGITGNDIFFNSRSAASAAGVPVNLPGENWVLVSEIHLQSPDGSIDGKVALGLGGGSGDDPGTAVVGSELLSLRNLAGLMDDSPYDGVIVPEIGPYPLVQGVSFPGFSGTTFSSIMSASTGALVHEFTHGFGIGHDSRNDTNFNGSLMFNGLRGMRGALFPDRYPQDHTRLAYSTGLALSTSRYFSDCELISVPFDSGGQAAAAAAALEPQPSCDEEGVCGEDLGLLLESPSGAAATGTAASQQSSSGDEPVVTILTSGPQTPVAGQIQIDFSASDPEGLSLALLRRSGGTRAELLLSGTDVTTTLATSSYDAGVEQRFQVFVYDVLGNLTKKFTDVTPQAGVNQAPTPRFRATPPQAAPNASVLLDGFSIQDPDDPVSSLTYEWQFDEGESFTAPSTIVDTMASYSTSGAPLVRLRVTDPAGAAEVSTPIAVRIGEACGDGIDNDGDGLIDYPVDPGCENAESVFEDPECDDGIDNDGDGLIDFPDDPGCDLPSDPTEKAGPEICDDGIDNDGDGKIDCADNKDCRTDPACAPEPEICDDGIDNDADGKIDCADKKDCGKDPVCSTLPEICDDGIDNDGDGKIDCADKKDCRRDPACP